VKKLVLAAVLPALLGLGVAQAPAHVAQRSGAFEVELGWGEEPPRVGADNFVEVTVTDQRGRPVAVPAEALAVEVAYGARAITLPLAPTAVPGALEAPLIPTRPGTYRFSVSGSVEGRALAVSATCSETTFECVSSSGATEFPVEDPSAGELAARLSSESGHVGEANERAGDARTLALVAAGLAAVALALSLWATRRRRGG
jgi:hypothetical protein